MVKSSTLKSGTALLVALTLTTGTVAPFVIAAPTSAQTAAQTAFPDVSRDYWAAPFISGLAARAIIVGFPDGTFRPEQPVTRAEFAAMINRAFNMPKIREPIEFRDVPPNFWNRGGIERAYTMGFMSGYPGGNFRPEENIPRAQVLVSLASGLRYLPTAPIDTTLSIFADASTIPPYARTAIAAATERRMVVNYPDIRYLNPNQTASRADVAAFVYQALVSTEQLPPVRSPYIVGGLVGIRIPAGTVIPIRYPGVDRLLLAKNEPPIPLTMKVAQNVVTSQGQVLIPAGSDVVGQLRTTPQGVQFVAGELVLPNGRRYPIDAASNLITTTEQIRKGVSTGKIVAGTLVGAGAALGIAAVTGDRKIEGWEVIPGAVVGAGLSLLFADRIDLFTVNPNTDLNLTLNSDLVIQ
jgi:hypothetical protein